MGPIDEQSFLLGFARSSMPVDATVLGQLALVGQRRRFERLVVTAELQPLAIVEDPRPILPEEARRLFRRLFVDAPKSSGDRLEIAAVAALEAAGRRLHPFDFAELEPLVLRHRKRLGPAAASWAALLHPQMAEDEEPDEAAIVDLRRRRESDPDRARSDIEAAFPAYPAATRLAILEALTIGLGEHDVGFLLELEGDKARTVRERAVALLGHIPGTLAYAARLARARDHLKLQTSGFLFKKKTLVVVGVTETSGSLSQLMAGLRIDDLARAIGLDSRTFVELAADTAGLSDVIVEAVLAERRYSLARSFETRLHADAKDGIMMLSRVLPTASAADRDELLRVCIDPAQWTKLPALLPMLHETWGGSLPVPMARRLLESAAWKQVIDAAAATPAPVNAATLEAVAVLVPQARSRDFIRDVEPLSRRAADYHRLLLALAEEAT